VRLETLSVAAPVSTSARLARPVVAAPVEAGPAIACPGLVFIIPEDTAAAVRHKVGVLLLGCAWKSDAALSLTCDACDLWDFGITSRCGEEDRQRNVHGGVFGECCREAQQLLVVGGGGDGTQRVREACTGVLASIKPQEARTLATRGSPEGLEVRTATVELDVAMAQGDSEGSDGQL